MLPSLHAAPFGFDGLEQTPVDGLHVPTSWHWSLAVHSTGFAPVQAPVWQVSDCVHALPSLHAAPFGFEGFEQTPVDELQVPALWHWSLAVQVTGVPATHAPAALQVSAPLHKFASAQLVPAGTGV